MKNVVRNYTSAAASHASKLGPASCARVPRCPTRAALINGAVGLVSFRDGKPFSVGFTVRGGTIVEMDFLADPVRLGRLDLTILGD